MEKRPNSVIVKVGQDPHPMESEHYIEWIEVIGDGRTYRKFLEPGQNPEAEFDVQLEDVTARAFCNVHGLWKV